MIMIMFRAALYSVKEPAAVVAEMEVVKYDENAPGVESADDDAPVIY